MLRRGKEGVVEVVLGDDFGLGHVLWQVLYMFRGPAKLGAADPKRKGDCDAC